MSTKTNSASKGLERLTGMPTITMPMSTELQSLFSRADSSARSRGHESLDTGHILLAVLNRPSPAVLAILTESGVRRTRVRADLASRMPVAEKKRGHQDALSLNAQVPRMLRRAAELAAAEQRTEVDVTHLLGALLENPDSIAGCALREAGVSAQSFESIY